MIIIYIDAYRCVLMIIIRFLYLFQRLKRLTGIECAREQHISLLIGPNTDPCGTPYSNVTKSFKLYFLFSTFKIRIDESNRSRVTEALGV